MRVRRGRYLNNANTQNDSWEFLEQRQVKRAQRHPQAHQLHTATGLDTGLGATASTGSAAMNPYGHGAYVAHHAHLQQQQQLKQQQQQKQAAVVAYARLRQLQLQQQQPQQQRSGAVVHPHLQHTAYSAPSYGQAQVRALAAAAQAPHHNPYQHLTPQHGSLGVHHRQQHPMAAQTHSQLNHHHQQHHQHQQQPRVASSHSAAKSSTTSASNDSDSEDGDIPAWILARAKALKSQNRPNSQQAPSAAPRLATNDDGGNDTDDATDYSSDDDNADATNWRPVPVSQPAHPSHVARQQYLPTPSVASRTRSSGTSPTHRSAVTPSLFPHQSDPSRATRGNVHPSRSRAANHGGPSPGGVASNLPTLDKSSLKIHPSRLVHMQPQRDASSPKSPNGNADASTRSPSMSKKRPPPPREPTPEPEPQRLKMRKLLPDNGWDDPPKELKLHPSPISFEWLNWACGKWGKIREARRATYRENFGEKQQGRFYNTKTYQRRKKHWTVQRDDPTPEPPTSIASKVTQPLEARVFTEAELETKEAATRKNKRKRKTPRKGGNDAAGGPSPVKKAKKASTPGEVGGNASSGGGKGKPTTDKAKAKARKKTKKPRKAKPKKPKASAASPVVKSNGVAVPPAHVSSKSTQSSSSSQFATSPSQTPHMNGASSSSSRYGSSSSMSTARSQSPHITNGVSHTGMSSGSGRGPSTYSSGDIASSVSPSPIARSHNSTSAPGRSVAASSRSHSRNSDPSAQSRERDPMMDHSSPRVDRFDTTSHKITSSLAEPHNFLKASTQVPGSSSDDPFSQPLLGGTSSASSFRNGGTSSLANGLFGSGSDGMLGGSGGHLRDPFDHAGGRGSVVSHMDGVHDPFSLAPDDRSSRASISSKYDTYSGSHSMSLSTMSSPFAASPRGSDPYGFANGSRFS